MVFPYASWRDASSELHLSADHRDVVRLHIVPSFSFPDPQTAQTYQAIKLGLIQRNMLRDSEWSCTEAISVEGLQEHVTAVGLPEDVPCWLSKNLYFALSLLVLNWPYCIWFDSNSLTSTLNLHKQISILPPGAIPNLTFLPCAHTVYTNVQPGGVGVPVQGAPGVVPVQCAPGVVPAPGGPLFYPPPAGTVPSSLPPSSSSSSPPPPVYGTQPVPYCASALPPSSNYNTQQQQCVCVPVSAQSVASPTSSAPPSSGFAPGVCGEAATTSQPGK